MKIFGIFDKRPTICFLLISASIIVYVFAVFSCISTNVWANTNIMTKKILVEEKSADRVIITAHNLDNINDEIKRTSRHVKNKKCKPANSPPIKDKNKIYEMLKKSGKVTVDMTDSQQKQIVDSFIHKKTNNHKSCKL
tara:strand:+ start:214 stop:627 length:414 start_codon:yes stop_codon:yes gene_type:complete